MAVKKKRATKRYARVVTARELRSRQVDPARFSDFRRVSWQTLSGSHKGRGVSVVLGSRGGFPLRYRRGEGQSEIQSLRFDPKYFTRARARSWLKKHGFHAALEGDRT